LTFKWGQEAYVHFIHLIEELYGGSGNCEKELINTENAKLILLFNGEN
jgi:hypothetical protein